jgi:uncharacterized protein (DUF2062 family)
MPKKTLKQIIPGPHHVRKMKGLHIFGDWLYASNLWHLNRYSASMAFFVGLLVAFMPIPGQMVLAAAMAIWLKCNLPLSVALVFVTNPVTMAPVFFLAYKVGALIIGAPLQEVNFELSFHWLGNGFSAIWKPFLLGCLICGLSAGSLGYFVINMLWRWQVARKWRQRKLRRSARRVIDPG